MRKDVDFSRGVIHIRRNNWRRVLGTPKTPASRRTVPMGPDIAAATCQHRARMLAEQHRRLASGIVFATEDGALHKGNPMGAVLRRALARAGVDVALTVHGLRRTFNDLARRIASDQTVRAIVGHTSEAMTHHYSVVRASETRAVQAAVIELARPAVPCQIDSGSLLSNDLT